MGQYAIVAIGYNRPDSMQRLLSSLAVADYGNDDVTLIVSIDNSGSNSVEKCANAFEWAHGEKKVITYPERQGLRNHILHCGDFVKDYDAIAVFEDDVVPAIGFYQYMKQAVEFYKNDNRIAGISLYNHLWNVNVRKPFIPQPTEFDTYFLQFAQSWGQVWMKKQWFEFAEWYKNNSEEFGRQDNIPNFVSGWPKTSWLKYHIKFCIERNKYFVYPYNSLATCFSDVGEHCSQKNTLQQVPLTEGVNMAYRFCYLDDDAVRYDAFFERQGLDKILGKTEELTVDLYGSKPVGSFKRYLLSTKVFDYKIIESYALEMRPHEINVKNNISGKDIFLYDTYVNEKNSIVVHTDNRLTYYHRLYGNGREMAVWLMKKLKKKLKFDILP